MHCTAYTCGKCRQYEKLNVGMYCDDLPDCPYWQWFEAHKTPVAAAKAAIRSAKEY